MKASTYVCALVALVAACGMRWTYRPGQRDGRQSAVWTVFAVIGMVAVFAGLILALP